MRRNRHGMGKARNPLAVLLAVLFAIIIVLLICLIVTNAKYKKTKKELTTVKKELYAYEQEEKEREEAEEKAEKEKKEAEKKAQEEAESWLSLAGHGEFSVKPTVFFDKYYSYSTTDKLRLRAGPGTNYDNIVTIPEKTEIKAAARDADWTFVNYDGKFGWVKTEYLKLNGEEPKEAEAETEAGEEQPAETKVDTSVLDAQAVTPVVKN